MRSAISGAAGRLTAVLASAMCLCLLAPGSAHGGTDCDLAKIYSAKGRNNPKHWHKAIELCPGYIRPYELLGNHYRKEGDRGQAIELFSRAAALGTRNHKLYYLLALLLFENGDLDQAAKQIDKSLALKATYTKAVALREKIQQPKDTQGPQIEILEPATRRAIQIVYQEETMTVRGMATDKSGIEWVKVDGMEAAIDEEGNFLKDVPVREGASTIVIEAADTLGNRSRVSVDVERKTPAPRIRTAAGKVPEEPKLFEKSYAVVIGINNYRIWPALEFAVDDARAIERLLKSAGFDGITTLLDKEATQSRILTELFHELPRKVTHRDRVMFYFAGHGQTEDLPAGGKRGYIIPVDADQYNYSDTAISMDQIRSLSRHIPAKQILYVMDSCYSGLGLSRAGGMSPKLSGYLRKVSAMRVVQIITAGGKGEQVQEKDGHGLFTIHFLGALEGRADINQDRYVTGSELGAYLRPVVSDASGQSQTPLYGRLEGEGEFIFSVME